METQFHILRAFKKSNNPGESNHISYCLESIIYADIRFRRYNIFVYTWKRIISFANRIGNRTVGHFRKEKPRFEKGVPRCVDRKRRDRNDERRMRHNNERHRCRSGHKLQTMAVWASLESGRKGDKPVRGFFFHRLRPMASPLPRNPHTRKLLSYYSDKRYSVFVSIYR